MARESVPALLWRLLRSPAAWVTTVDVFVILLALALPWSTTLVVILACDVLWTMLPFLDIRAFLRSLTRPVCVLPIALFALAAVGMLWSDAPWGARLSAAAPAARLLMLPVLFYHFERSTRGPLVLAAFLISCALLMVMSWAVAFDPGLSLQHRTVFAPGIFVKNYIDQSQEFALCAVVLAYPVVALLREKRFWPALALMAVALSFVANMVFVIVSRTALVTMPVLLAIFAWLHLKRRSAVIILCAAIMLAGLAWAMSPQLRSTVGTFESQYQAYKEGSGTPSIGLRLEFWQKSLRFFADAPVFGHGTGSTHGLFEQAAVGQVGAAAEVTGNPHNQTLNVAVQWGVVGIVVLYAMWLQHLLLFRGDGLVNWIGLLVVAQNIFTSLFNSHLFDFHEGWMYVLGVGVAGGMMLKNASHGASSAPGNSVRP